MRDRDEGEQSRKLFIGGLDYDTTDEKLRQHFEQWGELTDHVVMKFPDSKRSRGFGFVTYASGPSVDNCLDSLPHTIDGKTVEIKRATPREDDHGRRRGRGRFDDDEEYDPESKQMRKLFVGGLSYQTSEEQLREYFEQYGELVDSVVMKFPDSGRSRGFGFVTFEKAYMVDNCQKARPHELDGKTIETKRATPKSDAGKPEAQATVKKIFVGGLSDEIEDEDLKEYFGEFGKVTNVDQLKWNDTGKKRGFGFVEFDDHDAVDKIVLIPRHPVKDRKLEVKKALSKSEMELVKQKTGDNRGYGGGRNDFGRGGGGGGYNNRGNMGMGGGNMGMGMNNMGMGMNNMGMGMGMNNMGMGMGNMGMNNMGMGMNNMGMGMNNMGMGMGNMGMGGGMGGNMGGGMGGNMGGGMGGGNMGGGMGGGNMGGGGMGGGSGGGGSNMGGGNRRSMGGGDSEKSKSDQPVYSTNTGANPGYKTEGGNSGSMGGGGGGMGQGMGGGMGGNMGMGMNNMGMGGMGMNNMGMGMGNMGMGGGMGGGNMGGGMGGGNMGGRSGGGPMRQGGGGGGGQGGGAGRDAPYSRGGSSSGGRGGGGSRW